MPIILIGGLAVGGFLLYKQGALDFIFNPQPAAAPAPVAAAPVSGASTTTTAAAPCMGSDVLTGQPCACAATSMTGAAYAYPTTILGSSPTRRVRGPKGQILVIPGSTATGLGLGSTGSSATCDCSKCGGTSPFGSSLSPTTSLGSLPSQFGSIGDLNNFVGSSIAQAGYRLR